MNREIDTSRARDGAAYDVSADEQELIAYHLGEPCNHKRIAARCEVDAHYAELSAAVAQTLRVFSAEPVAAPDASAAWKRLSGTLPVFAVPAKRRWEWRLLPALAALLVVAAFGFAAYLYHARKPHSDEADVIRLRPPAASANAESVAQHLDRAERWLTVVNHSSGLDASTSVEGEQLLTKNAAYLRTARSEGDQADAVVLERLDRVLTTVRHAPASGVQVRLDLNTEGLLFELRILRQNQTQTQGGPQ